MTSQDAFEQRRQARAQAKARDRAREAWPLTMAHPRCDEPTGEIYLANLAAHGGKAFRGGPVCWDPRTLCEHICRDCPHEATP